MSSISSMDTVKPPPSPSASSSPTLEDDIAHTRAWLAHDASTTASPDRKGKRRQYVDLSEDNAELSDSNTYPPVSDQEAETRRVEETLRKWEVAERQRRKAARGSVSTVQTVVTSPSLLSDVTRRASLLWSGARKRNASIGGQHTALTSTDNLDVVPLEDIADIPTPTPSPSPSPSPSPHQRNSESEDTAMVRKAASEDMDDTSENPFKNPASSTLLEALSPFADTHRLNQDTQDHNTGTSNTRSSDTQRSRQALPPPMPLNLPRPKTPPPVEISTPPYPTSPPDSTRSVKNGDEDGKPIPWWHEWLCGCGEGPDRGGDYQAGRTNPFE